MKFWRREVIRILYLILFCLHLSISYFGLTAKEPLFAIGSEIHHNSIQERMENNSPAKLCVMLKLYKKQKKMCRRGKGVAETLITATRMSVLECQYQFKYERWNCTLGRHRQNILKKGFKETAFLYAISSAGIVHAFARACSRGISDRCTCDEFKNLKNKEAWKWGGCGDNIRFGMKFTRKFLRRAKKSGKDIRAKGDQHNSDVGRRVVKDNVNVTCKCHGVSGSCTTRTCWRQLSPFYVIGDTLKTKYENSFKVVSYTNQATGKSLLVKGLKDPDNANGNLTPKATDLIYIEDSVSFCKQNKYSPGTYGRICNKETNCDVMCCGRGYNVQSIVVKQHCQCHVIWCCYVKCKQCLDRKEIYTCK